MYTKNLNPGEVAIWARQGENGVTTLRFALPPAWQSPSGTLMALYAPPGESAHHLTLTREQDTVCVVLGSAQTARAGVARLEIQLHEAGTLAKTAIFTGRILPSLGADSGDPGEPEQSWIDQLTQLSATVQQDLAILREEIAAGGGTSGGTGGGQNGITPHIGANGHWYIGTTDTGVTAQGQDGADGQDGITPHIGENGHWYIGTTDTGVNAQGSGSGEGGQDGITPHIGENGHWYIGTTDTGVTAQGQDGADGRDGVDGQNGVDGQDGQNGADGQDGITPHIGANGHWYIGTTDTGVTARGQDGTNGQHGSNGQDGADGQDGITPHIGANGHWYIGTTDTGVTAQGKDGTNGQNGSNGQDGADGQDGLTPYIGENGHWYIGTTDTGVNAAARVITISDQDLTAGTSALTTGEVYLVYE